MYKVCNICVCAYQWFKTVNSLSTSDYSAIHSPPPTSAILYGCKATLCTFCGLHHLRTWTVHPLWQSLQQWPLWLHMWHMCVPSLLHWRALRQTSEWVLVIWHMQAVWLLARVKFHTKYCMCWSLASNMFIVIHAFSPPMWGLLLLQWGNVWDGCKWRGVLSVPSGVLWRVLWLSQWQWVLRNSLLTQLNTGWCIICPSPLPYAACSCLNGGECVTSAGSTTCNCPEGFTGDHCETEICESLHAWMHRYTHAMLYCHPRNIWNSLNLILITSKLTVVSLNYAWGRIISFTTIQTWNIPIFAQRKSKSEFLVVKALFGEVC